MNAAGSLPGDLHKLWRTRQPGGYHMEYGYSTMGYEIPGGLGVKMADPSREKSTSWWATASFLMMSSEIATSVQEGYKLNIIDARQPRLLEHRRPLAPAIGSEGLRHQLPPPHGVRPARRCSMCPSTSPKLCQGLGAQYHPREARYDEFEKAVARR